jgi:RimJ/RimL family protein N-acetyltransferase
MSQFEPKPFTLRDGTRVELGSPGVEDAERLLAYLDRVRRETTNLLWGPEDRLFTVEEEQAWVRGRLESPDAALIAAWHDGGIIGLGGVDAGGRFNRSQHRAGLGISLLAEWCNRGLGTLLMRELIEWARAHPQTLVLQLSVNADNARAIAVYEKTGFAVEGRRRWAFRLEDGTLVDELIMSQWVGPGEPPPAGG